MKPFNLEEAKAGKPVCTRDGRPARIICFDAAMSYPIVALVHEEEGEDGAEELIEYGDAGQFNYSVSEHRNDLFMASTERTAWVNLYREGSGVQTGATVYKTKDAAIQGISRWGTYLGTSHITYEE